MTDPASRTIHDVRAALARKAYAEDHVRLTGESLAGGDCLLSSRLGLFAVRRGGAVGKIAHGHFFGLRLHDDSLYLFESCDRPFATSDLGRIVRMRRVGDRFVEPVVLVRGLSNECHQVAVFDEALWVVDTANQAVLQFTLDGAPRARHTPFAPGNPDDVSGAYLHVNGIARIGDRIALMLHNGVAQPARPSEVAWLDRSWTVLERTPIDGHGCHDIVADETGVLWHCASREGALINSRGLHHVIGPDMTRGLAVTPERIVVGTSALAARPERGESSGAVHFLRRDLTCEAVVPVIGAPTDLVLL